MIVSSASATTTPRRLPGESTMRLCYFGDAGSIHILRWCTHFAALGHEIHLISFNPEQIPGVQTHHVDAGPVEVTGGSWRVLLKNFQVRRLVRQIRPDVLHAFYATSYGISAALVGFHPLVITALGSDVLVAPQSSRLYRVLIRFALRKADWVTAMAEHMRTTIIDLGVDATKVATVPFGIDPTIFFDARYPRDRDCFVVASTRNFEAVYNIEVIIDAVALARDAISNLIVRVVGSGSQRQALQDRVQRRGLSDIVQFVGRVSPTQLAQELNRSSAFVSVSSSDGNNVSLNEAMACGAFPIVTNIAANTQWIRDHENGFLVPVGDVTALADRLVEAYRCGEPLRLEAAERNRQIIAERAVWSDHMAVVERHYQSMVSAR